ncbi:MAG: urease accessory protein UreF [Paracoccaceae bacterium]
MAGELPAEALIQAWLSPATPTGGFAYSHGIERAVADRRVRDAATATAWIADLVEFGAGRADVLLIAEAMAGDPTAAAEHARARAASRERLAETEVQGAALARLASGAWDCGPGDPVPWPVALGRAARAAGIAREAVLARALQAFVAGLAGACLRLVPLGQTEGQRLQRDLVALCERVARETAAEADAHAAHPLDAHGQSCFRGDISAMRHETQTVRLFRS